MVYKLLCVSLLICCMISCAEQRSDDSSLFPTPLVPEPQPEPRPTPQPIPQPEPVPVPEPEPEPELEPEPEPVPRVDPADVRDLVGPKLLKSSIVVGEIDVNVDLDIVTLEFDEKIAKSDLKIVDRDNASLKWTRIIEQKEVILAKLAPRGKDLKMENTYSIIGTVEDKHQNARVVLITFTTSIKE